VKFQYLRVLSVSLNSLMSRCAVRKSSASAGRTSQFNYPSVTASRTEV
jgi:hypothetical protein